MNKIDFDRYYFNSDFVREEIIDGQKYVEIISDGKTYIYIFVDETESQIDEVIELD